jgi:hypothetical protein
VSKKDRARPFSKKHRRYWIPVTGGMLAIGLFNLAIGYCAYKPPETPQRIELHIPPPGTPADTSVHALPDGTTEQAIGNGDIPGAVMRSFTAQFPRTIPAHPMKRTKAGVTTYRLEAGSASATYAEDGEPAT